MYVGVICRKAACWELLIITHTFSVSLFLTLTEIIQTVQDSQKVQTNHYSLIQQLYNIK